MTALSTLLAAVAHRTEMTAAELTGRRQTKEHVYARDLFVHLATAIGATNEQIGEALDREPRIATDARTRTHDRRRAWVEFQELADAVRKDLGQ